MKADLINPFLNAMINVMGTMAQTELKPGVPKRKKGGEEALGDVSGIIGMVGPQTKGSMSISFEQGLVLKAMERMLGEAPDSINGEVVDMVGEITNMVTGGAKNELGDNGLDFEMATPTMVRGPKHSICHSVEGPTIVIPFESDVGKVFIEICFIDRE